MSLEFEVHVKRIYSYLNLLGIPQNVKYSGKSILKLVINHWVLAVQQFFYHLCTMQQMLWLILLIVSGENLLQITYLMPCLTFCMLGSFRIGFFICNLKHVNAIIIVLTNLCTEISMDEIFLKIQLKRLYNISNLMFYLAWMAVAAFGIGPLVMIAWYYYTSGVVKLFLPFVIWYPFDMYDIRFWPVAYLHEMWAAWAAVLSVHGPDCFFFTCCTFIHVHFITLHQDIEKIIKDYSQQGNINSDAVFKKLIVSLVERHRRLIRCVELLEIVYSKSTLFNVITGSLIICVTGFNLMAFKNYVLMAPFCSFLIFGLLQVFLYCHYGDSVMKSSLAVGDAIYNSCWYDIGTNERKYLLTILIRSQVPSKFTGYGFIDINMKAFTRILSTSWSYFALLNQMYHD